jgi:colanic acid biosynthesis glycosyl transferase WcaI
VHEATFVLTSFLRALTLPRPEVAIIVSPPLLLGGAGWLLGALRGTPFIFHVQDLQPDAAVGLGMLKRNAFTRLLYRLEAFAYAKAARVSGISHGMLRAFSAKGVPEDKTMYFPNGVQAQADPLLPRPGKWRHGQGFGEGEFLAVYAGNLGMKQGLEILLEAARLVRDARVRIVICGQGAARERLLAGIKKQGLPNLVLLPLQDDEAYREMMADTDLCLITQQSGTGQYFFPSKLLTALAFAKPVLAVADADSELAFAMSEGNFGFQVPTEDPAALAGALTSAARMPAAELEALGEAGRRFGQRFAMEKVLGEFARVIEQTAPHLRS